MISNEERLTQVLLAPFSSEKSARISENSRQETFKVLMDATKREIKQAVELLFKVEVESVNVLVQKGKSKRVGKSIGTRSDWKKAYITLKKGSFIDLVGGA